MDLSIIIVNWNSMDYLDSCLASIYRSGMELSFETIVIDNASFDGSKKMIQVKYPNVQYIQSNINGGFSYANNLGFREAKGNVVLFLNPDTEVIGNAVQSVYEIVMNGKDIGIANCVLLNSDGSIQSSCVQPYPTIFNQVLDSELLRTFIPRSRLWGNAALLVDDDNTYTVEALSGAFLMMRREVFEEVGGFDEGYFMYAEDIDLSFRIARTGRRIVLDKGNRVMHHRGGSTSDISGNCFSNVMMRNSIYRFLSKHRSPIYAITYRTTMGINAALRLFVLALFSPVQWFRSRRSPKGSFAKWSYILKWALGGENRRRNNTSVF